MSWTLFSRSERKGVLLLLILIVGVVIIPRQFRARKSCLFLLPKDTLTINNNSLRINPLKFKKTKSFFPIELNTADSISLVRIKGIGPYYAAKILRYRERLGGFYTVEQLKEIHAVYLNADSVIPFFTVNPQRIQKRELDTMSFKSILRHPYLEYEDVQKIFNARRQYGYVSYTLLKEKAILQDNKLKKINPYFR